jgi:hypothetical protein
MEIRTTDTSAQSFLEAAGEQQRSIAADQVTVGGFIANDDGKRQFTGAVFTCPSKEVVEAALEALKSGRETEITKQVDGKVKEVNRKLKDQAAKATNDGKTILAIEDDRTVQNAVTSTVFEACQAKLAAMAPLPPVTPAPHPAPEPAPLRQAIKEDKVPTGQKAGLQGNTQTKPPQTRIKQTNPAAPADPLPSRPYRRRQAPVWECCDDYCIR